jgi:hypothetical protein
MGNEFVDDRPAFERHRNLIPSVEDPLVNRPRSAHHLEVVQPFWLGNEDVCY